MHNKQFSNVHVRFKSQFIVYANAWKNKKKNRDLVFESFIKTASRSVVLRSLTSRIKGDHAYRSDVKVGDHLFCTIEPDNKQSDNATAVKSGNYNIVGRVAETLAKKIIQLYEKPTDIN